MLCTYGKVAGKVVHICGFLILRMVLPLPYSISHSFFVKAHFCVCLCVCVRVCVCVFRCTLMLDTFMLIPGVSAPLAPRVMLACTTGPTCHARLHHWPHVSCLPAPLAPRVMLACTIGPTCHVCLQESSRAPTLLIVAEAGHHNPRPPRPRLCLPSDLI